MSLPPFEYDALLNWFASNGRTHLPWRNLDTKTKKERGYFVWLSEILLQQTQAERVVLFYKRILETYPTVEDLSQTSYELFFPLYQWLGYYSRARNLLKTAKIVSESYGWVFPEDTNELLSLPWVGKYTAEAIRSFAYQIPTLCFDTNLEKIFSRYYHGSRYQKLSPKEKQLLLEAFQNSSFSGKSAQVNAAFMDLATIWSKNQKGLIDFWASPFSHCRFTQTQGELEQEIRKPVQYFPKKDARIFVHLHENHTRYFSSDIRIYTPFNLNPSEEDVRKHVQNFFRTTYQLEVSVRPPHFQEYIEDVPHIWVFAQIQSGTSQFPIFGKVDYLSFLDSLQKPNQ